MISKTYRKPPEWALKSIQGGRLRGFTEISPIWRLEALTEIFGDCGTGWRLTVDDVTITNYNSCAVLTIKIHINYRLKDDDWSEDVPAIGCDVMRDGFDENTYKNALTDAIGQACKLLLIGTDVYKMEIKK